MLKLKNEQGNGNESMGEGRIAGELIELVIEEKKTTEGKPFISGIAKIEVEQAIEGQVVKEVVPVRMFSMQKTAKGEISQVYNKIKNYKEEFIPRVSSLNGKGSMVSFWSNRLMLKEQTYSGREGFSVESNFMNAMREQDKPTAEFNGVFIVLNNPVSASELDDAGAPTGRLKLKMGAVGYKGDVSIFTMYLVSPQKVAHVMKSWNQGDTVKVSAGLISCVEKVTTIKEEVGFGEPIIKTKREFINELIIVSGSATALEPSVSYDPVDLAIGLKKRVEDIEGAKVKRAAAATVAVKDSPKNVKITDSDLGLDDEPQKDVLDLGLGF